MSTLKKGDVVVLRDGRRAEVDAMAERSTEYVWLWVGNARVFTSLRVSELKDVVFRKGITPEIAHNHAVNEERFHAHPGGAAPHWHRSVRDAANVSGYRVRDIEEGDANWGDEDVTTRRPVHGV